MANRRKRLNVKRNLSASQHVALVRKWRRWIRRVQPDLSDLLVRHETFERLREIVERNPRTRKPDDFVTWIVTNYVCAATVGVRRLCDLGAGGGSLGLLLRELVEHPGVLVSRVSGRAVSPQEVRADRRALSETTRRIRLLVNKRVAHADKRGAIRKVPTYSELDRALGVLDRLTCKYLALLTRSGLVTCKPERQYDWYDVLTFPWIEPLPSS